MYSTLVGTMRASRMMRGTAAMASVEPGKEARRTARLRGRGRRERVTSVMTAKVPSEPTRRWREVVAGHVLAELAAQADGLARGQDGLEPRHVARGDAVLHRLAAPRVLGHVAAHEAGLEAHGVARVPQAVLLQGLVDGVRDDARLGHDHEVLEVDLEDAVHALEGEDDAAQRGHAAAREAGAGPARRDRDAALAREGHDRLDLGGAGRLHHGLGHGGVAALGRLVARVGLEPLRVAVYDVCAPRRWRPAPRRRPWRACCTWCRPSRPPTPPPGSRAAWRPGRG